MIGQKVSQYEVLEKLGEGGMGVVYKARDPRLDRLVALKFLPPDVTATPEKILRFEAEARAISALNHPHIATIHAMDEDAGRRFLVLEYLPGGTLRSRLQEFRSRNQPLPIRDIVAIAIELAEGLGHAHRHGIVHRDLKPENVMFTAEGLLRITDFGLAKSVGAADLTRDGTVVGTAAYMAPEQATRNETSPRSDLFSLGIMLHEMIAGHRPFSGISEFATLHALVHDRPPLLRDLRPDAPPDLARIVLKLLEKDPARRYQNAEGLAAELSGLDTEAPTAPLKYSNYSIPTRTMTGTAGLISPRRPWIRQWKPLAALALGAVSIAGIAGFVSHSRNAAAHVNQQLAVLPFTANSGKPEDTAFGSGLSEIVAMRLAASGSSVWIVPEADLRRNRVTTPAEARHVFGIPTVLTGAVERQPSGGTRVDLNLIDTASGVAVQSTSVASKDSSSSLQDEVMKKAAAMIGISFSQSGKAAQGGTTNAYDYYVLGKGYLQRYDQAGNLGSAIESFRKAIQLDPSYALAYAGLSSAYWRQYRSSNDPQYLEQAREAAMQALSRNQNLDEPHITLGGIAVAAGQVDEGIRQLRIALDEDPVNAEACRELAGAYVAAGKLDEAETTYKRAIQFRPGFWLGYFDLATFYNDHSRYEEAEQALQKAASLTPDNYLVWRNLGGVEMARGEWSQAEQSFKRAIQISPRGSIYSNLGALYIYLGRYADAVPALEQAVALSAGDRNAYLIEGNLGDAYRWAPGRRQDAGPAYAKAIQLALPQLAVNPDNATLLSQIAVYYAKMGDARQAGDRIRAALKAAPKDPAALYRSAIVLELAGQRKQSLAALQSAVASGYSSKVIEREPELASLRTDPAWSNVAARAKEQK